MESFLSEFKLIGPIEVNISELYKQWKKSPKNFSISVYEDLSGKEPDKYTLIVYKGKDSITKAQISIEQATEIIEHLKLKKIKDPIFNSGSTYRSQDVIVKEIKRLLSKKMKLYLEVSMIENVIRLYQDSL